MEDWKIRFNEWQYAGLKNGLFISTRELNQYLNLIERSFSEMLDEPIGSLSENEAKGLSEQERNTFEYYYSDSIFSKHSFPDEFYKSFVISLYSKIERQLIELCERELELKLLIAPSDTEYLATGISRAQKFLAKATGYSFDNHLWQELQLIGKVRNRLVHDVFPYIAPVQKPRINNVIKVSVEVGRYTQSYYLQMDNEFYKHTSKHKILEYGGGSLADGSVPPEKQFAWFYLTPDLEYCRYLVDFRKRLFLSLYNGLLKIAQS